MSLHDFSNLAVQDIADEAAAMQSGGIEFKGINSSGGSFPRSYLNSQIVNVAVGATIESFNNLTGSRAPIRTVSKVAVTNHPLGGTGYKYTAYSGDNQTGSSYPLDFRGNGTISITPSLAGNVGSARIIRSA